MQDLHLALAPGRILGVIGPSGAGKSTLIRLVNGLERPSAGRIALFGRDVTDLSETDWRRERRRIGMIFQHFNLLSSRTVFDNVALPLEIAGVDRAAMKARVGQLIDLVGLTDKSGRYPAELSAGRSSASESPGRLRPSRASCSATRRPRRSIPRRRARSFNS